MPNKRMISLYIDDTLKDEVSLKMKSKIGTCNLTYLIRALLSLYLNSDNELMDSYVLKYALMEKTKNNRNY